MPAPPDKPEPSTASLLILIVALTLSLATVKLLGPHNLLAYAQDVPAMYVLDVVQNGHWLIQHDARGLLTSKPPLFTWLAATASLATGKVTQFSLALPSVLATFVIACLFVSVRRYFGWRAVVFAAVCYLFSIFVAKQIVLVRTDTLFTATVCLVALAAFHAWQSGNGWTWFWVAAAFSTLTKGPLGLVLGAAGLLAAVWERRTGNARPLRGSHLLGVILFFAIAGGWFAWALAHEGSGLYQKMIRTELIEHALAKKSGSAIGSEFYKPPLYFLLRFAPWSLLTLAGLWRVIRRPATDAASRGLERFLFCWFVVGLFLFSLGAHVRPDLLFPILPAAALLAGRELGRWLERLSQHAVYASAVGVGCITLLIVAGVDRGSVRKGRYVKLSKAVEKSSNALRRQVGDQFPLTYVDRTLAVQFHLQTMRIQVPYERAAEMLTGDAAAFVVVHDLAALRERLPESSTNLHELARCPDQGEPYFVILSNRAELQWEDHMTAAWNDWRLWLDHARLLSNRADEFVFASTGPAGKVTFRNDADLPRLLSVRWQNGRADQTILPPGKTWSVTPTR